MSGSSSHGFDPYSAWCILSNAAKGKTSNRMLGRVGIPFEELIGSRSNLVELGKTLAQYNLPERSPEEIHEELLRWRAKWNRVFELKKIESGVRDLPMIPHSKKISFPPEAYEIHVMVIDFTINVRLECMVIVLICIPLLC